MPSADEMPNVSMATRMNSMITTIRRIVDAAKTEMPKLIDAVIAVAEKIRNPRSVERRMKIVGLAMDAVSKFASTLKDLKGLKSENDLGSVGEIMSGLIADMRSVVVGSGPNLSTLIQEISDAMGGVSYRGIRNASRSMEKFSDFATKYGELVRTAMGLPRGEESSAGQAIIAMVQEYADIKRQLEATPVVGLAATIDRFGQNLSISQESIRIQNSPININVSLNLSMDANQIAIGLARDNKQNVVQLSRAGGNPQPSQ